MIRTPQNDQTPIAISTHTQQTPRASEWKKINEPRQNARTFEADNNAKFSPVRVQIATMTRCFDELTEVII